MYDLCCESIEKVVDGELVDTYGGDYTFKYVYACKACQRVWVEYTGAKAEDVEELYDADEKEEYLRDD